MAIYKVENGYRFKCRDINNKMYYSKIFETKKEARKQEEIYKDKMNTCDYLKFGSIAEQYFEQLIKSNKRSTAYTYRKDYNNHLKDYFSNFYINSINSQIIDNWCVKMENKGLTINYMNKIYVILTNILNYAMRLYDLKINYATIHGRFKNKNDIVIKDKDKLRYITYEEFEKFISVVDDKTYYTIFQFLFRTGVRKGELIALTIEDIDLDNRLITIDKTLNEEIKGDYIINSTKNNQNRVIKMDNTLYNIMVDYINYMKQYTDYSNKWFLFGGPIHLSKSTLNRYKHKYFELSGIHEITIHEFRHSHVSLLINEYVRTSKEKNVKIDTAKFFLMLSNRMGHTIQVMQDTYMHLFPTIQDEIVDLLDNL